MQHQTDGRAAEAADDTRTTASVRGRFDELTWQQAWAEGRAMPLEQAIAYARNAGEEYAHAPPPV